MSSRAGSRETTGDAVRRDGTSLRTALAARVLLPVTLVLGATTFLGLRALQTQMETRMKEDVELVARALRLPLIHAMSRDREGSVSEALRSAFRIGRVYGAYVYGPDGEVIAAHGATMPLGPPERLPELFETRDRTGEFGSVGGRRVYSSFVPLTDDWGRSYGLLQVTRRQQDFEQSIARLRLFVFGGLLLAMIVVTVLVLHGHHRAAIRPLRRLSSSMARVGAGDTGHRAATDGPRELATVAATFNGMLDALQATATELRERRKTQDALSRDLAAAERMAAVGELSAGVAHELGTPLSVIDGRAQRWLRAEGLPGTLRGDLETVRGQVRGMEGIVRQLLEFGRTETGRRRLVDLEVVVRGAVSTAEEMASEAGTRLEVCSPDDPARMEADVRRLEEVVGNLVRNAVQAAPGGHVRIAWGPAADGVRITVEDDGPGVGQNIRDRIFEPFFTTKATGEGSGLGLAVVHGVVDEHGGTIDVGTSSMGGARFTIILPSKPEDRDDGGPG